MTLSQQSSGPLGIPNYNSLDSLSLETSDIIPGTIVATVVPFAFFQAQIEDPGAGNYAATSTSASHTVTYWLPLTTDSPFTEANGVISPTDAAASFWASSGLAFGPDTGATAFSGGVAGELGFNNDFAASGGTADGGEATSFGGSSVNGESSFGASGSSVNGARSVGIGNINVNQDDAVSLGTNGGPSLELNADGSGSVVITCGSDQVFDIENAITGTLVGAAGGASALPASPLGYLTITINGAQVSIPYYNI
jgi:hypothetical protein